MDVLPNIRISLSPEKEDNMYCIDASVLVNSFMEHEDHHEANKLLIEKIKKEGITVILPEIVLPEVSSAIARYR
ncbi:MAG: hypothetical protein AYK18_15560 [Theionarchaea archaeon DG-70]|nr:MAG: hypothetical protein AYK18_15560 [Theionarchaea archaeon DG-70]